MASVKLDEDSIDEILYLARANEASELATYLDELSTSTKHSKADIAAAAVDPNTKNTALHYAAANGHVGMKDARSAASERGIIGHDMSR